MCGLAPLVSHLSGALISVPCVRTAERVILLEPEHFLVRFKDIFPSLKFIVIIQTQKNWNTILHITTV